VIASEPETRVIMEALVAIKVNFPERVMLLRSFTLLDYDHVKGVLFSRMEKIYCNEYRRKVNITDDGRDIFGVKKSEVLA